MDKHFFSRAEAIASGFTASGLATLVRRGHIDRLGPGLYATEHPEKPDELWRRELRVLVARGGSPMAVCGVSAALLHGLDGFDPGHNTARPVTAVMTANGHVSDDGVRRSRLFLADRIVFVDGLAVTNPLDTVADLGHYADADQVELALESVLRGNDPRRPDVWHQDRFTELVALAQVRGSKGRAVLLQVLRRRGDVVPTGSAAETIAAIAFRENGVVLSRQVRVRIFDRRSRLWQTYWLDFADISRRLAIEIDGRLAHNSSAAVQRDYRRDNVLSSVFTVLRFTASEVARDPAAVADAVQRRAIETPPVCGSFRTDRGFLVTPLGPGADRVDIVDPAL